MKQGIQADLCGEKRDGISLYPVWKNRGFSAISVHQFAA